MTYTVEGSKEVVARPIGKLVVGLRNSMLIAGQPHEAGDVAEVFGDRQIGMVGMQPDPASFVFTAAYHPGKRKPFEVYVSDGSNWRKSPMVGDEAASMEEAEAAMLELREVLDEVKDPEDADEE